jgi:hypothetical protein
LEKERNVLKIFPEIAANENVLVLPKGEYLDINKF